METTTERKIDANAGQLKSLGWSNVRHYTLEVGFVFKYKGQKFDNKIIFIDAEGIEKRNYFRGSIKHYLNYRILKKSGNYTDCDFCGGTGVESISNYASSRNIICRKCGGFKIMPPAND